MVAILRREFCILTIIFLGRACANLIRGNESSFELLVTTAFWNVNKTKQSDANHYHSRLKFFMGLNADIAMYGNSESLKSIFASRKYRSNGSIIRLIVESNFSDFEPCKSHMSELTSAPEKYTHPYYLPSVELGCVWLSKLFMLQYSAEELPKYEWHLWLDIGLHLGPTNSINISTFPNIQKLRGLPMKKLIVSHSEFTCSYGEASDYYLGQFPYKHCIAGTSYLIHRDGLPILVPEFRKVFEKCLKFYSDNLPGVREKNAFPCIDDQIVLSHIDPKFIHDIHSGGKYGYGAVAYDLLC